VGEMEKPRTQPEGGAPDALTELGAKLSARPYARRGVPMSTETIRVVLADDHAMVREGLRVLLGGAADIVVVGEAENGVAAVALAHRTMPDVVVLDLDMPGGDGMVALRQLAESLPAVGVLVLTMYQEQDRLLGVLQAGARGYLTKQAASNDLVDAIRVVAAGEVYVRPTAARMLAAAVVPQTAASAAADHLAALSEREQTILSLVAQGYSGAEIARRLNISSKTVAAYKQRIREKLGLEHRTDYVRFAVEAGILSYPGGGSGTTGELSTLTVLIWISALLCT
jgi:two-component system, NarL family, response regulator NreC